MVNTSRSPHVIFQADKAAINRLSKSLNRSKAVLSDTLTPGSLKQTSIARKDSPTGSSDAHEAGSHTDKHNGSAKELQQADTLARGHRASDQDMQVIEVPSHSSIVRHLCLEDNLSDFSHEPGKLQVCWRLTFGRGWPRQMPLPVLNDSYLLTGLGGYKFC